ncbi:hypothetical protein TNCV_1001081 [Trichonephila clavipes]|nr:hypothetical protein TNCV_1001081 [Trichonephila clavipes]
MGCVIVCDSFVGCVIVCDGLVAIAVDRWRHDCCGSLCTARVTTEGRLELGTFRSENEYLSHHAKTIVKAWRLLLVYIDITTTRRNEKES